jgi:hypothetical protein
MRTDNPPFLRLTQISTAATEDQWLGVYADIATDAINSVEDTVLIVRDSSVPCETDPRGEIIAYAIWGNPILRSVDFKTLTSEERKEKDGLDEIQGEAAETVKKWIEKTEKEEQWVIEDEPHYHKS